MACRGSGQVISNLGGAESKVPCPWCGGNGRRIADVDAQARWVAERDASAAAAAASEAGEGDSEPSAQAGGPPDAAA